MHKKTWLMGLAGLMAVALPLSSVSSVSLKDKQRQKAIQEELDEEVASANEACGTKLTATLKWETFKMADSDTYSFDGYCAAPVGAMRRLCDNDTGKEAVQKGVKKVVCQYGGKGKRAYTLKDGTLTYTIDFDAPNNDDAARDFLENNL